MRLGARQTVLATPGWIVYRRVLGEDAVIVALNLSTDVQEIVLPGIDHLPALLLSSAEQIKLDLQEKSVAISLPPLSGALLQ
jgi:hypothetical protein